MTIFITGSSGKTAKRLTAQLLADGHRVLVASRSAPLAPDATVSPPQVRFDWLDASTHSLPFEHPAVKGSEITAAYVVLPQVEPALTAAAETWMAAARDRGVRRFVLLSSSALEEGGPLMGQVHASLRKLNVEWAVLRPSWFMENFSELGHAQTIKNLGQIFSSAGNGKVPFVSAGDIAAVAAKALTNTEPRNGEYLILGPELLSYSDAARVIGDAIGKKIVHVSLPKEKLVDMLSEAGMNPKYADALVDLDVAISKGSEERLGNDVEEALGRRPIGFAEFVEKNRQVWL